MKTEYRVMKIETTLNQMSPKFHSVGWRLGDLVAPLLVKGVCELRVLSFQSSFFGQVVVALWIKEVALWCQAVDVKYGSSPWCLGR